MFTAIHSARNVLSPYSLFFRPAHYGSLIIGGKSKAKGTVRELYETVASSQCARNKSML